MAMQLTPELAASFASSTLAHVAREYPNKLDHVLTSAADVRPPRSLHPVFYGSFDWHSCVHGWWQLTRLLRLFPSLPQRDAIDAHFQATLTQQNVEVECEYLRR